MHATSYQSLLQSLYSSPESSSSASVSDSAGESLATLLRAQTDTVRLFLNPPSNSDTSDSLFSMDETEQDRLRSQESLLLSLKVADCPLFNARG